MCVGLSGKKQIFSIETSISLKTKLWCINWLKEKKYLFVIVELLRKNEKIRQLVNERSQLWFFQNWFSLLLDDIVIVISKLCHEIGKRSSPHFECIVMVCNVLQQICQGGHRICTCNFICRASSSYPLFCKVINQVLVQLAKVVLYKIFLCWSPVRFSLFYQSRRYGWSSRIFNWSFHRFWILNCEFDMQRGNLFAYCNRGFKTYLHFTTVSCGTKTRSYFYFPGSFIFPHTDEL